MRASVRRYYERRRTGKSILARTADTAAAAAAAGSVAYAASVFAGAGVVVSTLLSAAFSAGAAVLLVRRRRRRTEEFAQSEQKRIRDELIAERLVMMSAAEYANLTDAMAKSIGARSWHAFCCHPADAVTLSEVLLVLRSAEGDITLLSPSGFSEDVDSFSQRLSRNVTFIGRERFVELARECGCGVDDAEAERAAAAEMEKNVVRPSALKAMLIARGKAGTYLLCGLLAAAWMFLAGAKPLFPVVAAICFVLAFFSFRAKT